MCPASLHRDISPPLKRKSAGLKTKPNVEKNEASMKPTLAAIEAGEAEIRHHLDYFVKHFARVSRQIPTGPCLNLDDFQTLYQRNQHAAGRHFVIHQHDHPIAGVHYDLRLQFSATSSISFAIPYGVPGNPNSIRPNRMAIETRVHNLWNNLIESASHATSSLLIWDTGEYEVIPRAETKAQTTDDELSDGAMQAGSEQAHVSHSEMLFTAFRRRHIRLRLHGTRLPEGYTIALRLPLRNDSNVQPRKPRTKRRRVEPSKAARRNASLAESDVSDDDSPSTANDVPSDFHDNDDAALASDGEEEVAAIRENNAYPGATNSIGSIHQRHWFLTLDRKNSGFRKGRKGWWEGQWKPFFVLGREKERSIVTGRLADDIMNDQGVEKFIGRKMWRPITE